MTLCDPGEMAEFFRFTIGQTMSFVVQPWQLFFAILAGWVNHEQQKRMDYLSTENQVPKETHGKKRILLNDDQRRRLAVKGKILGRKALEEVGTLFTPDTILRWHFNSEPRAAPAYSQTTPASSDRIESASDASRADG